MKLLQNLGTLRQFWDVLILCKIKQATTGKFTALGTANSCFGVFGGINKFQMSIWMRTSFMKIGCELGVQLQKENALEWTHHQL
jgi:hypothetical protein